MSKAPGRASVARTATQVGEFAVGVALAYAAVAAAWVLSPGLWPVLLAAVLVVGAAVLIEMRFGAKATGFVVGLLPTALLSAGVFIAISLVLLHVR